MVEFINNKFIVKNRKIRYNDIVRGEAPGHAIHGSVGWLQDEFVIVPFHVTSNPAYSNNDGRYCLYVGPFDPAVIESPTQQMDIDILSIGVGVGYTTEFCIIEAI